MNYQTRLIFKKYSDHFSNLPVCKPIEMKEWTSSALSVVKAWKWKKEKSILNLQDPFSLTEKKPGIT